MHQSKDTLSGHFHSEALPEFQYRGRQEILTYSVIRSVEPTVSSLHAIAQESDSPDQKGIRTFH
ncbi:hypothetical protein GZ78_16685 [Endozoicomonas numazuensis]|uniref:Uncharacterized protein n=1 Tax=Endozoicomonas numazuensis TaxID=1137799 RepID=A0A081NG53_9GAMM|nr:hypothetical protein GZ78_16685 [Endozoicomonas numazuensis]